jgi:uncharacterized protein (TIGR03086 family)
LSEARGLAFRDDSTDLLEIAVGYAVGSLSCVTSGSLSYPTPCAAWNLRALLEHVSDSLAALHDAIATGWVSLDAFAHVPVSPADDLVTTLRIQAGRLLAASAAGGEDRMVAIAGRGLTSRQVTAVGAVEIAVHGWDIAEACRCPRPIPPALATSILAIIPLVVTHVTRNAQFAGAIPAAPQACPSDRLVALLGRNPEESITRC